uniref:Peptidase A2 domain-containing protein n=1 Tax=Cacopsylla melanoneura TaxID=428564 RepID=A0A8D9B682_9HEMI
MSEAKLKLLEARRSQLFGELQKCHDLAVKYNVDKTVKVSFLGKVAVLESNYSEYKDIVNQIQSVKLAEDDEYEPNFSAIDTFNDIYAGVKLLASKLQSSSSGSSSVSVQPEQPKLPALDLPYFDGNLSTWTIFYETYNKVIHENKCLSNEQKIQYLLSRLKGSALSVCAGIPATGGNYDTIFTSLIDRYQDKRALAAAYMDKIINFSPIKMESRENYQEFLDQVGASVLALKALNIENFSEYLLYYITVKKIDHESVKEFERSILSADGMPQFDELLKFVRNQARLMERVDSGDAQGRATHSKEVFKKSSQNNVQVKPRFPHKSIALVSSKNLCPVCKQDSHALYKCSVFMGLDPSQRVEVVKANRMCFNCLSNTHQAVACPVKTGCKKCGYKHNTMLHLQTYSSVPVTKRQEVTAVQQELHHHQDAGSSHITTLCSSSLEHQRQNTTVLLSTVKVAVQTVVGETILIRMLLDSASMSHFLTVACCKRLGIQAQPMTVGVGGIGGTHSEAKGVTKLTFSSRYDFSVKYNLSEVLVVDKITNALPLCPVDIEQISQIKQARLSDDEFHSPGPIDGLIGAELFSCLIGSKKKIDSPDGPIIMESVLGDIIMGRVPTLQYKQESYNNFCAFIETPPLETIMQRFWTMEEVPVPTQPLSAEDAHCEAFFQSSCKRQVDGSYSIGLPFKVDPQVLGNSFDVAKKRKTADFSVSSGVIQRRSRCNALRWSEWYSVCVQAHISHSVCYSNWQQTISITIQLRHERQNSPSTWMTTYRVI